MATQLAVIRSSLYSAFTRYSDLASSPLPSSRLPSDILTDAPPYSDGIVGDLHPASLNQMLCIQFAIIISTSVVNVKM